MRIFETTSAHRVPRIQVINLVDILFILLIFFIATTTFRMATPVAVKLALPEAKTAEEIGKEKTNRVLITVAADETIYLNSKPIAMKALEAALHDAKTRNPNLLLQLS